MADERLRVRCALATQLQIESLGAMASVEPSLTVRGIRDVCTEREHKVGWRGAIPLAGAGEGRVNLCEQF
jgi:hypothetical protein